MVNKNHSSHKIWNYDFYIGMGRNEKAFKGNGRRDNCIERYASQVDKEKGVV
jgi:hypothetical protein